MANIKKNFNFRNGVQVDDDNLLVTSTGLVGIGTTVPTEALDVRGNATISGFTSITNASIGIVTITTLDPSQIIGAGVSIKSGIITAQGAGIVTFFGDARFLQGMPTSQWQDVDVGLGYTSIFNTGGNVGIATTDPRSGLQIGNNVDAGQKGVGISSAGNINASGIISATSFVGDFTGNIVSPSTFSGNVTLNADFDVDGHTNLDNVNIAGVTTFASGTVFDANLDVNSDIDVDGHTELDNVNVSGIATIQNLNVDGHTDLDNVSISGVTTFTKAVFKSSDLDVDGHANLDNVSVAGVTTFAGIIEGVAGQNKIPFLYSSMSDLPSAGSYHGAVAHVHATGALYFAHAGQWWELLNVESSGRVGTGTENYDLNYVGAATTVHATKLGVGTTEAPVNDIQVRNSGNSEIQITSETGIAGLTFGRETGTSNTNNGELRYGGGAGFTYSSDTSLDIINYGTGNFNYHLSGNNANAVAGDFHWHKGLNSRLMTLTGIGGSLGIGITTPSAKFEVAGSSKFSGNVEITNNLTLNGAFTGDVTGNLTGNVTGNVFGLIDSPVTGISTIRNLFVSQGLGIGITDSGNKVNIGSSLDNRIFINNNSQIGIKTDTISDTNVVVEILGNVRLKKAVSVGNTTRSAVDFSDAVNITNEGETGLPFNRSQLAYMIPPRVTTAQRNLLRDAYTNSATLLSGAMVYNTTVNKLQVWNGSAWETVTSS